MRGLTTTFRPYGSTTLIAQHWLKPGEFRVVWDGLPGTRRIDDGVIFTPFR